MRAVHWLAAFAVTVYVTLAAPAMAQTHPNKPIRLIVPLIQLIKANPGKYNYASGNTGGIAYGGHIRNAYQLDVTHVPYKSTPPALADLLSGHVQIMVGDVPSALAMIRAGKVRAVGMTTAQRHALLPDVATFSEQGLGTPPDMSGWWCAVAPAGTPAEILDRLNKELVRILGTESVRAKMLQNGLVPMPSIRRRPSSTRKISSWSGRPSSRINLKVE